MPSGGGVCVSSTWTIMRDGREGILTKTTIDENDTPRRPLLFRGYMPGLDVLRGLAILGVLCYHGMDGRAPWTGFDGLSRWIVYATAWGASGVQLFFVLSGFLITGVLLDNVIRKDYYARFYFNRACRILPAYFLILIALRSVHVISWRYVLACVLYIANMAKLVGAANSEYGAFWSLAVEEQFYLVWPAVVRRFSLQAMIQLIEVYLIFAAAFRIMAHIFLPRLDIMYKFWGNADWLLLGALVAVTLRSGHLNAGNIRRWKYAALIAGALTSPAVVLLEVDTHLSSSLKAWIYLFYRWPVVLVYLSMLLMVIERNRGKEDLQSQRLVTRALSFLGFTSYGLYLVHPLVYLMMDRWERSTWLGSYLSNFWALQVSAAIGFCISVALAFVSRRYFEEFFLRIKNHRARMKTQENLDEAVTEDNA